MRIALLAQSYPPMVSGAALVVGRLAQGLAAHGHEVLVLAASDIGAAYDETCGSLQVARPHSWPNPFRVGQHFLLWPRKEIRCKLELFKPDVIHSHDPLVTSLVSLDVLPGVPRVLTVHQLPWFVSLFMPPLLRGGIESLLWAYGAWLYRRFQLIVTPSQIIADLVAQHTQARPKAISNGVDTFRFNPNPAWAGEPAALRDKYGLDPQLPIILYAGRVDADKRVELVVQAAALALPKTQAQLLIVGDGKRLNAVKQLAERLGIQWQSHFAGFVPVTEDLPGLYRLASVFVTASEVEIQSSVVLEAAATGLPVVTVNASSMPEFVRDGLTGYLVPPRDIAALADRIIGVLQDPARAQAMGRAALEVAQAHSHEGAVMEHIRLYESLRGPRL